MCPCLTTLVLRDTPSKTIRYNASVSRARLAIEEIPSCSHLLNGFLVQHLLAIQITFVHDCSGPSCHIEHIRVNVTSGNQRLWNTIDNEAICFSLLCRLEGLAVVRQRMIWTSHHLGQCESRVLHAERVDHFFKNNVFIRSVRDSWGCLACCSIHVVVVDKIRAQWCLRVHMSQEFDELGATLRAEPPLGIQTRVALKYRKTKWRMEWWVLELMARLKCKLKTSW